MGKLYDKIKKKVETSQQGSLYNRIAEKKKPQFEIGEMAKTTPALFKGRPATFRPPFATQEQKLEVPGRAGIPEVLAVGASMMSRMPEDLANLTLGTASFITNALRTLRGKEPEAYTIPVSPERFGSLQPGEDFIIDVAQRVLETQDKLQKENPEAGFKNSLMAFTTEVMPSIFAGGDLVAGAPIAGRAILRQTGKREVRKSLSKLGFVVEEEVTERKLKEALLRQAKNTVEKGRKKGQDVATVRNNLNKLGEDTQIVIDEIAKRANGEVQVRLGRLGDFIDSSARKMVPGEVEKTGQLTQLPKRIMAEPQFGIKGLPGYAPEGKPAFGLSVEPRKPVGFGKEAEKPLIKDVKKAKSEGKSFDEFVEGQTIFRGQPEQFKDIQKVAQSNAIDNILVGRGIFTTSDEAIARSYGSNVFKFQKPQGKVFDLTNATEVDLRKVMPDSFFKEVRLGGLIHRPDDKITSPYKIYQTAIKRGDIKDAEDILFENFAEKYLPLDTTWEEAKSGATAVSGEGKLVDEVRDALLKDLVKAGFGWVKHKGGIRAGSKEHDVFIALKDEVLKPLNKSQLKQIWEGAGGISDEALPKTEEEFLKLSDNMQEEVFEKLPSELQTKIMGISDDIAEPKNFIEEIAEEIASGKRKLSTSKGADVKSEAIEQLGKGNFARIFRRDKNFQSLDEIAEEVRNTTGSDVSTSDVLEEVSKRIDLRKTIKDEAKFKRAEDLAKAEEPVFTGAKEGLELPKSRTPMDEKTIVQRRKALVRDLRDRFGLTDSELRKISNNQDIRLMTNYGFKRFIDNIGQKAIELADTRQAKAELLDLRNRMNFQRESAYRQTQGFPPISKMTGDQMRKYADALSQYQEGDVFLTKRTLEVVDKTDLKGVRTRREAQERLLQELKKKPENKDLTLEELANNIKVSSFDQLRFDTALAEKNPFYGLMVERTHEHMLSGDARFLEVQNKVNDLAKVAKKSRKRGITGTVKQFLVPQYEEVIRYLEAPVVDKQALAQKLTKDEMDYAHFVEQYYSDAYDHLVQVKELYGSRFVDQYFTHTRRQFLEAWSDDGFVKAIREWWTSHKEDQQIANIIDTDTGQILPKSKFFANTLRRTGAVEPSKNLTRVFLQYAKTFERKKMFDQMLPEVEIYTESLTPLNLTPKGLEMDRRLKDFVKRYLNNKKGRRENFGGKIRQNGVADMGIRMGNTFVSLMDLGFNLGASATAAIGEQMMTYQALGKVKYTKAWKRRIWDTGIKRMKDKNASKILKQAEPFIGRNIWTELAEPDKGFGERGLQGIWSLFSQSSVEANKLFLLGSLSKSEMKAGKISADKMAHLRLQAGRWRDLGRDTQSIVGATSVGEATTKYKGWAIPIARTLGDNFIQISKRIKNKKLGEALKSREAAEIYRAIEMTTILLMLGSYVISEEKDDTFIGKLKARAYQESMTVLGGTDPTLFLSTPRLYSFLQTMGDNIKKIVKLEEYQQTGRFGEEGELKGVKGLQRQFTPAMLRQFKGGGETQKQGLGIPELKSSGGGIKIPELKSQI